MNEEPESRTIDSMDECVKRFRFLQKRLLTLENPDKLSVQVLRERLLDAKFSKKVEPPIPIHVRTVSPTNNLIDPKVYEETMDNILRENYRGQVESYKQELSSLARDELIDRCNVLREKTSQELEDLRPTREWWTHPDNQADHDFWERMPYWTVDEGIALSLGLEPRCITLDQMQSEAGEFETPKEYTVRHAFASRSIELGELSQSQNIPASFVQWLDSKRLSYPDELKQDLENIGLPYIDDTQLSENQATLISEYEKKLADQEALIHKLQDTSNTNRTTHTSELMEILFATANEHWVNHDPQNPPKKEVVLCWLKTEYPDLSSQRMREAIDSILRPRKYK